MHPEELDALKAWTWKFAMQLTMRILLVRHRLLVLLLTHAACVRPDCCYSLFCALVVCLASSALKLKSPSSPASWLPICTCRSLHRAVCLSTAAHCDRWCPGLSMFMCTEQSAETCLVTQLQAGNGTPWLLQLSCCCSLGMRWSSRGCLHCSRPGLLAGF